MVSYHVLNSEADIDQVVNLVKNIYIKTNYISEDENVDLLKHTYLNRGDAVTLFASLPNSEVIGTISVITDESEKLPMEDVYSEELRKYKESGFGLAEIRRFAIDQEAIDLFNVSPDKDGAIEKLEISLTLLSLAFRYANEKEIGHVCFMIKKDHAPFYESLGCELIGEERPCPAINNRPVVGYILDIKNANNSNFLLKKIKSIFIKDLIF